MYQHHLEQELTVRENCHCKLIVSGNVIVSLMSQIYFSNIFLNYIPFWDLQTHHLRTLKYLFML